MGDNCHLDQEGMLLHLIMGDNLLQGLDSQDHLATVDNLLKDQDHPATVGNLQMGLTMGDSHLRHHLVVHHMVRLHTCRREVPRNST